MKYLKSIVLAIFLVIGNSCTLDLLEDPNNVQVDGARSTLLLSSMQRSTANLFNATSTFGMQLTRQMNSAGVQYSNVFTPQAFDGTWSTAYANILQDAKVVIEFSDANGWARHAGIARVLSAYTLSILVDYFGDVPYSEALQGLDNLNPKVDSGADIYAAAFDLLNRAELDLKTPLTTGVPAGYLNPLAETPQDSYYANNYSFWIKLINTLKIKLALNLRLTNTLAAADTINKAIADTDGLILAQAESFAFRHSANQTDPDSRHPRYLNNYPGGGGDYMSNYLIWQMFHGYDATNLTAANVAAQPGDPRMRFYFYRQTNVNNTDPNNIRCVTATSIPAHYPARVGTEVVAGVAGLPPGIDTDATEAAWNSATGTLSRTFCFPTDRGYWGRDHVDNQGIPPDGLLRTAWGAYPAGGRFDGSSQQGVNATTRAGMGGAGIQPIMMRSFVQFMLAEASLYLGTTGTPRDYFRNGMLFSFDDVRGLVVNGTLGIGAPAATEAVNGSNGSTGINTYYPIANYTADRDAYVASALAEYDLAVGNDPTMNFIAREYWVASFGNGVESYNLYRRTGGMPTGMQPTLQPGPGAFPRSLFYPNTFATLNNTVEQKTNLEGKVFWDNNTITNFDF